MSRLILFDIDGTLIDAGGAGLMAIQQAAVEVFGNEGPPLDLAGSTDSGIVRGFFEHFGREFDEDTEEAFYRSYLPRMEKNLHSPCFGGHVLPGVKELIASFEEEGHVLGLLTGNIERGAMIKVAHYGFENCFEFGSYGDDHWDRNKLGPIALERAFHHTGREFASSEVVVIGDTPKDVACAKAFGARSVAVATGSFDEEKLVESGADTVVPNLVGFQL
ncbi:MAG: HAD family hydrolase [Akkermansiaceae bacterium]